MGFDTAELRNRRAFFELSDDDLAKITKLKEAATAETGAIVERFYELLLGHPETRRLLADEALVTRLKETQRRYFLELFEGRCDMDYVENRLAVGVVHERIGLDPKLYLGAYRRYLALLREHLGKQLEDAELREAYDSLERLVFFDMSLAIDTYIASGHETIRRHQEAVRELSTPVIKVHDNILLLPLVGTVDSRRAAQIMETVLTRVAEDQARVLILDIAGVAVVDTDVADHLLKTTEAVRLLGADTVLTGISAQVARTIVQLGVDISTMQTRARLSEGIEVALSLTGKEITHKKER